MNASLVLPAVRSTFRFPKQDERLLAAARQALRATGYRVVAEIGCHASTGTVVLSGVLPSYFLKQVARAVVLRLPVARNVENHPSLVGDDSQHNGL